MTRVSAKSVVYFQYSIILCRECKFSVYVKDAHVPVNDVPALSLYSTLAVIKYVCKTSVIINVPILKCNMLLLQLIVVNETHGRVEVIIEMYSKVMVV